ncbi:type I endonuclease-methyltransferase fusion protein [Bacteroidia bacterium]|nr:type I endonuclease-methyltransferase fusion protein [Bacteroidia bacterium]
MGTLLENNILEMFPLLTESKEAGVLLTKDYEKISKDFSPEILFALETANKKFNADAVYFRHFPDGRADIPQLYIFDYSNKTLSQNQRNAIHKQMWNGYQVPAYCIVEKSSVLIYDSRETPNLKKDNYASEVIKLTAKEVVNTIGSIADGLFWEEYNKNEHFKFEESAARDLIQGLKNVYKKFQEKSGIDCHIALKLLVQSILIKYLEERDEKSKSGYFAKTYFKKYFQCENFCDTIRKGKLLDLLDKLSEDFNGKVFEWGKATEEEKEARVTIQQKSVTELADYLDGNIDNNQYVLWRLYSFEHLPVEVISSVYEELLTNSKDIVYTPEMIVGTMVDECMPLSKPQKNFKLADVSCGSGIFLVKAYKRLVQWWRYEQWLQTGELKKPPLDVLKNLITKNIYGIDIQQDAIHLSVFSLALAVLDEVDLNPPTWEQLQFPDLSNNIVRKNFFEYIVDNPMNDFSLIIGNPPFNLPQVNGKEPDRKAYFKELKKENGYQSEINIPDENPALHFLTQSMRLLKPDAILCLILPSGPLLYQKDLKFKQDFFSKYNLLEVIDFTKLADKLWGKKNVATAAVFVQKSKPDDENVLHLVANRTFSNENRLFLEFDHYDFHWIDKNAVLYNPYIWKANLLGGGRIVQLIERLSELPTLGDYLKKKKKCGWKYCEGYAVGNKKQRLYESLIQNNVINRFHILTTSTRLLIGRITAMSKREIDNLPFAEDEIVLSIAEKLVVQDVLSYFSKQNQALLSNNAKINNDINLFATTFCKVLNSIYQTEEKSFQLFKILDAGKYYALHFEYLSGKVKTAKESTNDLEQYIEEIIPSVKDEQKTTHFQRIMKFYGKDCIILVKPKQLRYWLPSIALRDADEVFADYYKSRYPNA